MKSMFLRSFDSVKKQAECSYSYMHSFCLALASYVANYYTFALGETTTSSTSNTGATTGATGKSTTNNPGDNGGSSGSQGSDDGSDSDDDSSSKNLYT